MYSRDFPGIKSDGQLYELEREASHRDEWRNGYGGAPREECAPPPPPPPIPEEKPRKSLFDLDILRSIKLDDLLLIGIAALLLLDSDGNNEILILLIAFVLFM